MTSPTSTQKGPLRCCCSQVWVTNGGRILWGVAAICETFKISCLMEKTPHERRFGIPYNGPVIPFGAMVEYHSISAEDMSRLHQFGPKDLPSFLSSVKNVCGWNLERRHHGRRH